MSIISWWRKRNSRQLARASKSRRSSNSFRPRLQILESRNLLATLTVTTTLDVIDANDGALSLREAVIQANATEGADTINVPAGTFALSLTGAYEDAAATGDLDLTGHVTIQGAGAGTTVIDGAPFDRIFDIHNSTKTTLAGMTIQGGNVWDGSFGGAIANDGELVVTDCAFLDNHAWSGHGGAIFSTGKLRVFNSTFAGNSAQFVGGGIASVGQELLVANSTFLGNLAGFFGGGISTSIGFQAHGASATIVGCSFDRNSAGSYAGIGGGGIYNMGDLTVRDSVFSGNLATVGGGIHNAFGGVLTVANCTFHGNTAWSGGGGGIMNEWSLTVRNSFLRDNSADFGGGIYNFATGSLMVVGCTISDNTAWYSGGGVYNWGTATIVGCAITDNSAVDGGGIFNIGTLSLRDSAVVDNSATNLGEDVYNAGVLFLYDSVIDDLFST